MATSSVGPQVTANATYSFRATINQKDYAPPMARTIKGLGKTHPAILADTGPVGSTLPPDVVTALTAAGISAPTPVSYTLNSTDVSSSVAKIVAQKPDSLIIIGSASADQGLIVKTLVEQGLKVPTVGFGSLVAGNALKIGGAAYASLPGVYTLANSSPGKPEFDAMVAKYVKAYGGDASTLSTTIAEQVGDTYDGFAMIKQALDATKGNTDGATLAKALHDLPPYAKPAAGKVGAQTSFKDSQDGFHDSLSVFKVTDGKAVVDSALNTSS
jgi:branched-chain amino acid transport system substrate-binding protein